jgi:hypothetical protein
MALLGAACRSVALAQELDASLTTATCVETTGRSPGEVADEVVRGCGGLAALISSTRSRSPAAPGSAAAVTMPVLFLFGATGVGKSTDGFEIYVRDLQAGVTGAYIDAGQVGFLEPIDEDARHALQMLQTANLTAMAANFAAAGARQLVVTARADTAHAAETYAVALAGADVRPCGLHAGLADLTERVLERGRGGGWAEPGDSLVGRPEMFLRRVAADAAVVAATLDRDSFGVQMDTRGRSVAEVVDLVISATGWASVGGGDPVVSRWRASRSGNRRER